MGKKLTDGSVSKNFLNRVVATNATHRANARGSHEKPLQPPVRERLTRRKPLQPSEHFNVKSVE